MKCVQIDAEIKPDKRIEFTQTLFELIPRLNEYTNGNSFVFSFDSQDENLFNSILSRIEDEKFNTMIDSDIWKVFTAALKILCRTYKVSSSEIETEEN